MNGDFTAYVNEHQLSSPLALIENFKLNSTVNAKILYVMPLTKLIYLSLNFNPIPEEVDYHRGDIIENCVVSHVGTGGIVMILNGQHKGVISLKTIRSTQQGNYDIDVIMNKYSKKSKHTVRILEYDPVDCLYICTDDQKSVAEKYFTIGDLSAGDVVNCKVVDRNDKASGFVVSVGNIRGE